MSAHPTVPELVALARGIPSGSSAADEVRGHCLVCDECRLMLETILTLRDLAGLSPEVVTLPAWAARVQ